MESTICSASRRRAPDDALIETITGNGLTSWPAIDTRHVWNRRSLSRVSMWLASITTSRACSGGYPLPAAKHAANAAATAAGEPLSHATNAAATGKPCQELEGHPIRSFWLTFSDDDDLWHPRRALAYWICLNQAKQQYTEQFNNVNSLMLDWSVEGEGLSDAGKQIVFFVFGIALDSGFRFPAMHEFITSAKQELLKNQFCDGAFWHFVRTYGGEGGNVVKISSPSAFPGPLQDMWNYYYNNWQEPDKDKAVDIKNLRLYIKSGTGHASRDIHEHSDDDRLAQETYPQFSKLPDTDHVTYEVYRDLIVCTRRDTIMKMVFSYNAELEEVKDKVKTWLSRSLSLGFSNEAASFFFENIAPVMFWEAVDRLGSKKWTDKAKHAGYRFGDTAVAQFMGAMKQKDGGAMAEYAAQYTP
eukprot:gene58211-biopygen71577